LGRGIHCAKHYPYSTSALLAVKDSNGISSPQHKAVIPAAYRSAQYLGTIASEFRYLADDFAVNRITASVLPDGTRELCIEANNERERCSTCGTWFADRQKLERHMWEFPCGCSKHGMCFTKEDEYYHGVMYRHERCFVRGCDTLFRKERGWKESAIKDHVKKWHWAWG
jgi:hypothetical protein